MQLIRVAGAALNQTPMDWQGNYRRVCQALQEARERQVSILCLPELCISGYGCEDMFYAPGIHRMSLEYLEKLLPHTEGMVATFGLPVSFRSRIFNAVAVVANGRLLGFTAKRYLAGNGIHYEPRWFTPWPEDVVERLNLWGQQVPIGDVFFEVGGVRIGLEICEDAWVANRPGRRLYQYGVQLILNPSASHFAFQKLEVRKRFVLEGSRAFGAGYVYANLLGNESGRAIYDGGTLIANAGNLLAIGPRLSFQEVVITDAVMDLDEAALLQAQSGRGFVSEQPGQCIAAPFVFPPVAPEVYQPADEPWEHSPFLQEEEFARVQALALFDYMRKSYSKGFVLSLSGGADSSAILCCCYLMVQLATQSIGLEGIARRMSYFPEAGHCQTPEELMRLLVTTAYQPTENSGPVTRNAAEGLAGAVGSVFHVLHINEVYKGYTRLIADAIGRELNWEQDDIVLQNIQARVRAPGIWMLANLKGALLLSTSNRSEAAVGYATMDGDTSGGLSPIAGIDKAFLRKWLRWLENKGLDGYLRIPALRAVNEQQPTAELRPPGAMQTDEADLMPYDLLDAIEEAAIRDKKTPEECLALMQVRFPAYTPAQLQIWTDRFFRLWCRNQWKRERYAPSFHLDDKNLDPKTWCRFPILSGGFQEELDRLWQK